MRQVLDFISIGTGIIVNTSESIRPDVKSEGSKCSFDGVDEFDDCRSILQRSLETLVSEFRDGSIISSTSQNLSQVSKSLWTICPRSVTRFDVCVVVNSVACVPGRSNFPVSAHMSKSEFSFVVRFCRLSIDESIGWIEGRIENVEFEDGIKDVERKVNCWTYCLRSGVRLSAS